MTPNEFDPNAPRLSDPVPRSDEEASPMKMGIFAIIAAVVLGGLIFFGWSDGSNTNASSTSPGVTTGSSPAGPSDKAPVSR